MSTEPAIPPSTEAAPAAPLLAAPAAQPPVAQAYALQRWLLVVAMLALAGLVASALVWQKFNAIQQQLARQSADTGVQAGEARAMARQAQELALESAAKLAVTDAKLAEVSLQRSQLEELMQSLSRSRDENLVVDIESAVRLAQQQSQLTGSVEPLLAALKSADLRIARAAQPRLTQLQRAIARDVARIKATALSDTPSLLIKLDELVTLADEMPIANAVGSAIRADAGASVATPAAVAAKGTPSTARKLEETVLSWWSRVAQQVQGELRSLVRVSTIQDPDAALLNPEQSFFLRENLKLRLLNARLGLLSRQIESARGDLGTAALSMGHYFDAGSRKTQTAVALLQQVQAQMRTLEIPRIDDTLAALSTAAAGR
jgi:uroporphyrin-III C-methyltransferase